MSRVIIHIVAVVMAGYLAIVACDPNISHYCSKECEDHQECCHHHHHTCHCGVEIGEACHCGVTHIVAPESNIPVNQCLVPEVYFHTITNAIAMAIEPRLTECHNQFHVNHAPPILNSGREVITRKSVLLI